MKKKMSKAISILLVSLMLVAMFPVAFTVDEAAQVTESMFASNFATSGINFAVGDNVAVKFGGQAAIGKCHSFRVLL